MRILGSPAVVIHVLIVAFALTVAGCSSGESQPEGGVGTWTPVVYTTNGYVGFRNVFDEPFGPAHVEIVTSPDGREWTTLDGVDFPPLFVQEHAFFFEGRFVVVGTPEGSNGGVPEWDEWGEIMQPVVASSTDLRNWTYAVVDVPFSATADAFYRVERAGYAGSGLVFVVSTTPGPDVQMFSQDLETFTEVEVGGDFLEENSAAEALGLPGGYERLALGPAGFAAHYLDPPADGGDWVGRVLFRPADVDDTSNESNGSEWRVVAENIEGWVSSMAVGDNEIVITEQSQTSFETQLRRIPLE